MNTGIWTKRFFAFAFTKNNYFSRKKMNWFDKVVIITGAGSGIGKALVLNLLEKGAMVIGAARNEENLQSLAQIAKNRKQNFQYIVADVSIEADCKKIIDHTVECYGKIDVLINNAGISMRAIFDELQLDVLHRLMNTNYWGTVYCTHYAFSHLLKSKGSIVGVSSIAGFQGLPARTGYSSSKFAMHGFLQTIRVENARSGLHVMIACPGFTASNIRNTALTADGSQQSETPLDESKLMSAEEVAQRIVRGIEKRKRTLIMTMQGKMTVLLGKLFPAMTDKLVFKHMSKEVNSPLKNKLQ